MRICNWIVIYSHESLAFSPYLFMLFFFCCIVVLLITAVSMDQVQWLYDSAPKEILRICDFLACK